MRSGAGRGGLASRPPAPGPRREVALAAAAARRTAGGTRGGISGGGGGSRDADAAAVGAGGESLIDLEVRHERLREEAEAIRRELSLG